MEKHDAARQMALEMRNDGKSLGDICNKLKLSKTTVYYWIKDIKITRDMSEIGRKSWMTRHKNNDLNIVREKLPPTNKFYDADTYKKFSTNQRGSISASAVFYRLCAMGFGLFSPVFDGDRIDVVVESPCKCLIKLQIKSTKNNKYGRPTISLCRHSGNRKYTRYVKGEFDFIIGYCFYRDEAYVYSWHDAEKNASIITTTQDAKEHWLKLINFVPIV